MTDTFVPVMQWEKGWRSFCPDCSWSSGNMPFPDPDSALHAASLHKVLCTP